MSTGGLFSFNPAAGETPETLKRRRQVAEQLLANATGQPASTIGGGLAALGQAIGGRLALGRVNRAEAAGQARANAAFAPLFPGGVAAPGETAALPGTEPVSGVPPTAGNVALAGANIGLPDVARMEAEIRAVAPKYGIDPDVAVRVARSEGLAPNTWQSNVTGTGGRETSYGPFQLLAGGGLGDEFQRTTGLDVRDPKNWQKHIDFALSQAAKQGWTPWHGAANTGIGPWQGITRGGTPAVTAALTGTEPVASADPAALAAAGMSGGDFDFSRYATGGAAARPDSFSGLKPAMASGLGAMISSAPPDIQAELKVLSGYRSPETQERLWQGALKKYGSVSAARKWVAPPGRSQHGAGNAIDWKFASKRAREWAHANAGKYGFAFPLSNEPWHMELAGARGGGGRPPDFRGGGSRAAPATVDPTQSVFALAGGGGQPAVTDALMGLPRQQPVASADPAALTAAGMPIPYDPLSSANPGNLPFRPAGGPTPYSAGATVLGGGSANAGRLVPVPDPNLRPAVAPVAPVAAPAAPPVAPAAPAAPGVAPVAQALGFDPLPQTSAMPGVGGVQGAGHESLSPGAQAVSQALAGGGGTDTLAGGGGDGFFKRLFGGRTGTPPAVAGGGGAVPPPAATGAPGAAGGFSPRAQQAVQFLINNPLASDEQKAIAKTILDQEIEQADPKYRVELERARTELEQAQTPTRQLTKEELAERGLDPNSKITIDAKGNLSEVPQPKPITIDNRLIDPTTHEVLYEPPPGTKILTRAEAIDNRLDPDLGTWTLDRDGKPDLVEGTERPDLINVGGGVLYDPVKKEWITAPTAGKQEVKLTDESSLRKELESQVGTNAYHVSHPILSSMVASLSDKSAMADLDFIYGMAKIFDPSSSVKEGEMDLVQAGQSMPAQIQGTWNKLINGEAELGPQLRYDLTRAASTRVSEYRKQAETEATNFTKVAELSDMNPKKIVFDLAPMPVLPDAGPPPDAVKLLLADPSPAAQKEFDETFGAGAARKVFGF